MIEECSICLEKKNNNDFEKTKCHHLFCKSCLNVWTKINNTCPVCRQIINIPISFDKDLIDLLNKINFTYNEILAIMNSINIINNNLENLIN